LDLVPTVLSSAFVVSVSILLLSELFRELSALRITVFQAGFTRLPWAFILDLSGPSSEGFHLFLVTNLLTHGFLTASWILFSRS
jgi:hypothetical protein